MRELWADKAKFIGIILMLLGHNSLANDSIFDFIYSFHMPLFLCFQVALQVKNLSHLSNI